MKFASNIFCAFALLFTISFNMGALQPAYAGDGNVLNIELKTGAVKIKLLPEIAPKHVKRIKRLVSEGFYDGIVFHRVIKGFMAQTGDPTGTGTGGSPYGDLKAEFSNAPFDRGMVGMARSQNPHSANSQFFIMLNDGHFLNGQYTVFGKVISGMKHVDAIKKGNQAQNGIVENPDMMLRVFISDK